MKTKKTTTTGAERKTSGMKLVEKYRPRMSRLTDAERQKLTVRGLQIIYGDAHLRGLDFQRASLEIRAFDVELYRDASGNRP